MWCELVIGKVTLLLPFHAIQPLTRQLSPLRIGELLLAKIYEKSSLDHSFLCICNPRSNSDLLRDRTQHHHDDNYNVSDCCDGSTASPNATPYGRLLAGWLLIATVPFSGADIKLTTL